MQCAKTGAHLVTYAGSKPYQLYMGDRFECKSCGASIISGYGESAIDEHFTDTFTTYIERLEANEHEEIHHERVNSIDG